MTDNSPSAFLLLGLRSRRLILGAAIAGGLFGLGAALASGKRYESSTAIVIQESRSSLDALAGLASQFGVRVPRAGSAGLSAEFYRDLATSRVILEPLLRRPFVVEDGGAPAPLLDLLDVSADSERERLERGVESLRDGTIRASANRETGVIRVVAATASPLLSQALAEAVIEQMRAFDASARTTQAGSERQFLASRVDSARRDLELAERELQSFLQRNRIVQDSPELQVHRDRLQRGVAFRQQLLTTLSQAYEQARIEEVRNAPAITVLEPAVVPARREARGTVAKTLLGAIGGGVIGLFLALMIATVRQAEGDNWTAIRETWADMRGRRSTGAAN